MYCDFFGLRCRPFEDRADTQFCYAYADWEEALAATLYELHHGRGTALVLGEAGTGKTLLIRSLFHRLHASDRAIVLTWPSLPGMDLMRETCKAFGVTLPESDHHIRYFTRLRRHLVRTAVRGQRSILIVDQGENLAAENLEQIAAFSELQHDGGNLLSMVLVGQPKLRSLLDDPKHVRIAQRLSGERLLRRLSREETGKYIQHRLGVAGAVEDNFFADEAVVLIHNASNGTPRLINHIADAAMLGAYGADESRVTAAITAEMLGKERLVERSADARDLGVSTTERVAAGLADQRQAQLLPERPLERRAEEASATEAVGFDPGSSVDADETVVALATSSHVGIGNPGPAPPISGDIGLDQLGVETTDLPATHTEGVLASAEVQLRCLERASARAERVSATTDASLAKYSATEKHLTSLLHNAEGLITGLTSGVREATASADHLQHRTDQILDEAGARLKSIETQAGDASEISNDITTQKHRIEQVFRQADRVESRLRSSAEEIADKADEVQQRIALLMSGLESTEEARQKLDTLLGQTSTATVDAEERLRQLRETLSAAELETERFNSEFIDAGIVRYKAQVEREQERAELAGRKAVETTRSQLNDVIEQASFIDAGIVRYKDQVEHEQERAELAGRKAVETTRSQLNDVIEQASSVAANTEQSINTLRISLTEIKGEAESLQEGLTQRALAQFQSELREQLGAHLRNRQEATEDSLAAEDAKLEALREKVSEEFQTQMCNQQDAMERNIAMYRATLAEMVDDSRRQIVNLSEAANVGRRKAGDIMTESQRSLAEIQASVAATTEGLRREIKTLSASGDQVRSLLTATTEELNDTEKRTAGIADTVRDAKSAVAELTDRAAIAKADLTPAVQRCERLIGSVHSTHNEVEAMQRGLASTLVELGNASERIDTLEEQIARSEESASSLASRQEEGERVIEQLDNAKTTARETLQTTQQAVEEASNQACNLDTQRAVANRTLQELSKASEAGRMVVQQSQQAADSATQATEDAKEQAAQSSAIRASVEPLLYELDGNVMSAKRFHEELRTVLADVDVKSARLESQATAATGVLGNILRANETGCAIIQRAESTGEAASTASRQTKEQIERLIAAQASALETTQQLDELVRSAKHLDQSMQGVVAHVDEKVGQLGSHQAAATHLLRRLAEENVTGHALVERVDSLAGTLEQKARETAECIRDVETRATHAEHSAEQLTTCNERAGQLIERLDSAGEPAKDLAARLEQFVEQAQQTTEALTERYEQARELPNRLKAVAGILKAAKMTGTSIESTKNNAKTTLGELHATMKRAAEQDASLQELTNTTRLVIETLEKITPESRQAVEQLESRMAAATHSAEISEPMLGEFIKQAQALGQQLNELQGETGRVEERLAEVTAKPAELMESSQTQAAQLERVCGAVQKVFKALSKATLDAKKHSASCQVAADRATTRLTELTAETGQATATLHEWVEEALRVQARLEKTLHECPSIRATHPGSAVRRISNVLETPNRIANPSATELRMLQEPAGDKGVRQERTVTTATRSEEISRLIEDAKSAVTGSNA